MKEQSGLTETVGLNLDLTFATIFNLAEQYSNSKMWTEAINTYQSILKNRSFTNTGTKHRVKHSAIAFTLRSTSNEHWRDPLSARKLSKSDQIFPNGFGSGGEHTKRA